ncbi:MAG: NnrU family protein [Pseudomonadota bacterium]
MTIFIAGIAIFFSSHLFTSWRRPRAGIVGAIGEMPYKAIYSVVALVGFVLIVQGWPQLPATQVWTPPTWTRHLTALIMLPVFVLLVAAYAPAGLIKRTTKHPMLLAVKIWATAHLLANGELASVLLFGSFLAYAVYARIAVKRRETATPAARFDLNSGSGLALGDIFSVIVGLGVYAAMGAWLHPILFGVPAFA